jgi:MGT family glycosyltransferase
MTRSAAVFAMPETGHFQRLRPLIADLVRGGVETHVFTDRRFAAEVERCGGRFVDLFAGRPLDEVDAESVPVPCRYVSFAGAYAGDVAAELRALGTWLVVYDTFAVVGRVAALAAGLPFVNVCAGHNVDPARFVPLLEADPRVALAPACHDAVETLRGRYGVADASPFSYVSGLSPFLNLYCEPRAYLTEAERRVFEPVAFYGSLPSAEEIETRGRNGRPSWPGGADALKVYVSFGTVVWRYWPAEALEALRAVAEALASRPEAIGIVSLGGTEPGDAAIRSLTKPNVTVERYVDQWRVLRDADVFVTHQGLNSTHEAVFNLVPMVSYPFFSDQPGLAERCRELGFAVPLSDAPRGPVTETAVAAALAEVAGNGERMRACLRRARDWELDVIAGRDAVVRRLLALIPL